MMIPINVRDTQGLIQRQGKLLLNGKFYSSKDILPDCDEFFPDETAGYAVYHSACREEREGVTKARSIDLRIAKRWGEPGLVPSYNMREWTAIQDLTTVIALAIADGCHVATDVALNQAEQIGDSNHEIYLLYPPRS